MELELIRDVSGVRFFDGILNIFFFFFILAGIGVRRGVGLSAKMLGF